jgi:TPR repeat protein
MDQVKGAGIMRQLADAGMASAQHFYGGCLRDGVGVKVDLEDAVRYLKLAADQGHPGGLLAYGMALIKGRGVERNVEEGIRCLGLAAKEGDLEANYHLGIAMIDRNDIEAGCSYMRVAADGGLRLAQDVLTRNCSPYGDRGL